MRGHVEQRRGRWVVVLEQEPLKDLETEDRIRRRRGLGESYGRKRDAEAALRDAIDAARQGWRGPSRRTVADYLEREWLPSIDQELAPTTAALYRTLMRAYVIPRLGGLRLESIVAEDVTALYTELLAGGGRGGRALSRKTVRHVHTTLRRAFEDAVRRRHLTWNPVAAVKGPRLDRAVDPEHWTLPELRAFLDAIAGERLEVLWILAASTGMRRGELLGLRWTDVDVEDQELHVRRSLVAYGAEVRDLKEPKTPASRRTIPLTAPTVAALRRHRTAQLAEKLAGGPAYVDAGLVFADELGGELSPGAVSKTFARHVKAAGLRPITLHGLRHTFATLGLEAGVDVLEVAAVLGHSSPAITQSVYQHTRPERKRAAVDRIGAEIFG